MFKLLEETRLTEFKKNPNELSKLIRRNALLKTKVVLNDEFETGERKLLNFGHTVGHAIENVYRIPHGHAISIGMGVACKVSEKLNGFSETTRVTRLLKQYGLPPNFDFDKEQTFKILTSDKKKEQNSIHYIVLNKIGKAASTTLPIEELKQLITNL